MIMLMTDLLISLCRMQYEKRR